MNQRHKHADVIIAWANGAEVEYKSVLDGIWMKAKTPGWLENYEYRVKQPAKKYRVALFKAQPPHTYTANTQEGARIFEKSPRFIRWLTDWVEYEEK